MLMLLKPLINARRLAVALSVTSEASFTCEVASFCLVGIQQNASRVRVLQRLRLFLLVEGVGQ